MNVHIIRIACIWRERKLNIKKWKMRRWRKKTMWSDYSKWVGGHFIRIGLKIAKKWWLYLDIFSCVKINGFLFFVFLLVFHSDSRYTSDAIISTKLEQTGKIFWDSRCCLIAWVSALGCLIAWVSAFRARRMKVKWGVTLFYVLIVKNLLISATVY